MKSYTVPQFVRRELQIPAQVIAEIYADAAALIEGGYDYGDWVAVSKVCVLNDRPDHLRNFACAAYKEFFGGSLLDYDEQVLMLCFAAAIAETGDL